MNVTTHALQGLKHAEERLEAAAKRVARPVVLSEPPPADSVDLSQMAVEMIEAVNSYKANIKMLEAESQMQEHTLDLLA